MWGKSLNHEDVILLLPPVSPARSFFKKVYSCSSMNLFKEGFSMNCFHCSTRHVAAAAVAICLECGMAVCQMHAYERYLPAVPVGMAGAGSPPRRALVCQECFQGYPDRDLARYTHITPDTKSHNFPTFLTYSTENTLQHEQKSTNDSRAGHNNREYEPLDEQAAVEIADALVRSQPVRFSPKNSWKQKVGTFFNRLLRLKNR
jgi:hypothetical protein